MDNPFDGVSILVVEDDVNRSLQITSALEEKGAIVTKCQSYEEGVKAASDSAISFNIAIIDMYLPLNRRAPADRVMRGEELAITIRNFRPNVKIIGISEYIDRQPFTPFSHLFAGFVNKKYLSYSNPTSILLETIEGVLAGRKLIGPRAFIVHGHDEEALLSLKNYLQNALKFPEPVVLREQPSLGKTIIEKFEDQIARVDLVFVLLTPDDTAGGDRLYEVRRSRQNVIFELGFFYGQLKRTSGRIILLYKGDLELPSDISGIIRIPISAGVDAAGEAIRRELRGMGWGPLEPEAVRSYIRDAGGPYSSACSEVVLKIGIDTGVTLARIAKAYPSKQFLGVEIKTAKATVAAKRICQSNVRNAAVVCGEALNLLERHVDPNSLDEIMVFFPTPYENALAQIGATSGKLVNSRFAAQAKRALRPFGSLRVVTDEETYFCELAGYFSLSNWWPVEWRNIWPTRRGRGFVDTPCERRFVSEGRDIFAIQLLKVG